MTNRDANTARRASTRRRARRRPAGLTAAERTTVLDAPAVTDDQIEAAVDLAYEVHAKRLGLPEDQRGDFGYIYADDVLDLLTADRILEHRRQHDERTATSALEQGDLAGLVDRLNGMAASYESLTGDARPATALRLAQEIPHLIRVVRDLISRIDLAERTAEDAQQRSSELQADLNEAIARIEAAAGPTEQEQG